jgi:ferredoxin-type protein NapG
MPLQLAKGKMQDSYRLGWEEKEKAGGSLIDIEDKHRYNLPEGMRYDYQRDGLVREPDGDVPFSGNPLETLNDRGEL